MELSRIQKVQLREIWKHEATNFTRWLAKQENLALLSEEINIELTVIETEYNVGRFNVDIYAQETHQKIGYNFILLQVHFNSQAMVSRYHFNRISCFFAKSCHELFI